MNKGNGQQIEWLLIELDALEKGYAGLGRPGYDPAKTLRTEQERAFLLSLGYEIDQSALELLAAHKDSPHGNGLRIYVRTDGAGVARTYGYQMPDTLGVISANSLSEMREKALQAVE